MLKRVYDALSMFKEYVLFGTLLFASVGLLVQNDSSQIRALRSFSLATVGFLQETFSFIPNFFDLQRENKVLRELNLSLTDEVSRLREGRLENLRLRRLLDLKERGEYRYLSANVIGKTLQLLRNTVTLDLGESDGVKVNMPVVTDRGLAGRVIATSSNYAIAQLLLNKDLRVSAKIQRSRSDGIIRWEGGSSLILQDVVKTSDVQPGDVVLTSEYSSLFPPGIKIGIVSSTRQVPGSLFQAIEVVPSVDFSRLEEVFVVPVVPDSNRIVIERRFHE